MKATDRTAPDEDLLKPSLDQQDEASGFADPWNPASLVFAAFFVGPLAGGYLIAQNFKRLGMHARFGPTLAVFVTVGVVVTGTVMGLAYFDVFDSSDQEIRRLARLLARAVTIVMALIFTHQQKARFRLYLHSGHEPASLWGPGIMAFIAGFVLGALLVFIFAAIFAVVAPK